MQQEVSVNVVKNRQTIAHKGNILTFDVILMYKIIQTLESIYFFLAEWKLWVKYVVVLNSTNQRRETLLSVLFRKFTTYLGPTTFFVLRLLVVCLNLDFTAYCVFTYSEQKSWGHLRFRMYWRKVEVRKGIFISSLCSKHQNSCF